MLKKYLKLYLVLESGMLKMPLEEFIPAVIEGGVTCIQVRDKGFTAREQYDICLKVKELAGGSDVLTVVNDRADIAAAAGIHAVHVGIKDIPLNLVKKTFPQMITGYSCNDTNDIETALQADYIGVGPAFFTGTKADLRPVLGVSGIRALLEKTDKPAVAIGGINAENVLQLKNCGLAGVAVSSAVCASADPYMSARMLRERAEEL
jgi:thiamine-phosphate pyrophosphorylase